MNNSVPANPQHVPHSGLQWIQLEVSEDARHTVLPLIDIVPIEVDPPTPIGGIGILYKAAEGYAGYLSLRLHSLEFGQNLKEFIAIQKNGEVFNELKVISNELQSN